MLPSTVPAATQCAAVIGECERLATRLSADATADDIATAKDAISILLGALGGADLSAAEQILREMHWQLTVVDAVVLPACSESQEFYDDNFPEPERLPRRLEVAVLEDTTGPEPVVRLTVGGRQVGDLIDDNGDLADGYRFHDVFHFANAAVLGWSPIVRMMLKRKRKSDPEVDKKQDGARAWVKEESVLDRIFEEAAHNRFFSGGRRPSPALLTSIRAAVRGLEVADRTAEEWEDAIMQGFAAWRACRRHGGGVLNLDLNRRTITHTPLDKAQVPQPAG